jgi:FkbM family methyltransferase
MNQISGTVVTATIKGKEIRFFVANPEDVIQKQHFRGRLYEVEELAIIAECFPAGGVFVDIGTNVGNHAIFVGKYLNPTQVIAFEPNPPAIEILRINLALNGLTDLVDLSHLGIGLSHAAARANLVMRDGNLGATRLHTTQEPDGLPLMRGDDVLGDAHVDFIKLDVEGMEINVLRGLERTIKRCRPRIFVEVDDRNIDPFKTWMSRHAYSVAQAHRRNPRNENFMILPDVVAAEGEV